MRKKRPKLKSSLIIGVQEPLPPSFRVEGIEHQSLQDRAFFSHARALASLIHQHCKLGTGVKPIVCLYFKFGRFFRKHRYGYRAATLYQKCKIALNTVRYSGKPKDFYQFLYHTYMHIQNCLKTYRFSWIPFGYRSPLWHFSWIPLILFSEKRKLSF